MRTDGKVHGAPIGRWLRSHLLPQAATCQPIIGMAPPAASKQRPTAHRGAAASAARQGCR
ncbi:conserved hypothetical protein [Ricinus communis]|uniref:Uncharacterized protein n=1 Tax=Ricinus communis TaxID=3988 RepID=B9T975_RICCO|nr:conserved hypothetical protein [Ricinus communis]